MMKSFILSIVEILFYIQPVKLLSEQKVFNVSYNRFKCLLIKYLAIKYCNSV